MKKKIIKDYNSKEVKKFLESTKMSIEDLESFIQEAIHDPREQEKILKEEEEILIPETFADPTYDVTFKMLFGNEHHKDVLISLLNNLLDFHGNKEIIDVEINNNELPVTYFFDKKESGIPSTVDVLCTIKENNQKIAVEMQGQRQAYFLNRTQEYMAKLISGQVKTGQGAQYHKAVMDTYVLVIGKQDLFTGETKLQNQNLFEIDVEPRIVQTNETFPKNKMHWKFFELPKFKQSENYQNMSVESTQKEQWLEFLLDCSTQEQEPNRSEIIKKGDDIMKTAKWSHDTKVLYWKQKQNEIDALETQEALKQEEFSKGFQEGEIKGKIKGEIKQIKSFIDLEKQMKIEISKESYVQKLHYTKPQFENIKDYLTSEDYKHFDETESIIGDTLHLFDMNIEQL